MHLPGCLVSAPHPKSKNKDASCSGILISEKHGLVLTHSSLVVNLLTNKSENCLRRDGQISGNKFYFPQTTVILNPSVGKQKAAIKADHEKKWPVQSTQSGTFKTALLHVASAPLEEKELLSFSGTIQHIWKAHEFSKCVNKLFPKHEGWKFADDPPRDTTKKEDSSPSTDQEKTAFLLPYFVLIKIEDWPYVDEEHDPIMLSPKSLRKGADVYTMGTPFGALSPAVFMNSVSKGIVCNLTSPDNALFLTDARCIPGTEGGVILTEVER